MGDILLNFTISGHVDRVHCTQVTVQNGAGWKEVAGWVIHAFLGQITIG